MYDILNGFYLNIQIAPISISENELAKQNLGCLKELGINQPVLVILDRGYSSLEFIDFLEVNGINYLFRLSCNDYTKERVYMTCSDELICLKHTYVRLEKVRKKHP